MPDRSWIGWVADTAASYARCHLVTSAALTSGPTRPHSSSNQVTRSRTVTGSSVNSPISSLPAMPPCVRFADVMSAEWSSNTNTFACNQPPATRKTPPPPVHSRSASSSSTPAQASRSSARVTNRRAGMESEPARRTSRTTLLFTNGQTTRRERVQPATACRSLVPDGFRTTSFTLTAFRTKPITQHHVEHAVPRGEDLFVLRCWFAWRSSRLTSRRETVAESSQMGSWTWTLCRSPVRSGTGHLRTCGS